jgi:WD40 repeat protein/DNA-directed RNA polymerase subunit RPC12/RpoP
MSNQAVCPCGANLNTNPSLDGRKIACPACGERLIVGGKGSIVTPIDSTSGSFTELPESPKPRPAFRAQKKRATPTAPKKTKKADAWNASRAKSPAMAFLNGRNIVIVGLILAAFVCLGVVAMTAKALFGGGGNEVAKNDPASIVESETGSDQVAEDSAQSMTFQGVGDIVRNKGSVSGQRFSGKSSMPAGVTAAAQDSPQSFNSGASSASKSTLPGTVSLAGASPEKADSANGDSANGDSANEGSAKEDTDNGPSSSPASETSLQSNWFEDPEPTSEPANVPKTFGGPAIVDMEQRDPVEGSGRDLGRSGNSRKPSGSMVTGLQGIELKPNGGGLEQDSNSEEVIIVENGSVGEAPAELMEGFSESDESFVVKEFSTGEGTIRDLQLSSEEKYVAITNRSGNAFVLDLTTDKLLYKIGDRSTRRIEFSEAPKFLCTVADHNGIPMLEICDPATGSAKLKVQGPMSTRGSATAIAVSDDGRSLLGAWGGGTPSTFLWRLDALRERVDRYDLKATFLGRPRAPSHAVLTENGVRFAFEDGFISAAAQDAQKFVSRGQTQVHAGRITALEPFNNNDKVVTGGEDGKVAVTSIEDWDSVSYGDSSVDVLGLCVSSDDKTIAVARANYTIEIFRGRRVSQVIKTSSLCTSIRFINGNSQIIAGAQDGKIRIYDPKKKSE